jgi:hypothetical protein
MTVHTLGPDTLEIYKGEDKTWRLSVIDDSRNPVNLTSTEITMTVRPALCDKRTTIVKSSTDVAEIEIIAPATDGQAYIYFVQADTEDLTHGTYVFDIWIKLNTGKQKPIVKSSAFEILPAVTIPT